jgi:dTDP-4-dehydrorhamnose reductase
MKVIFLTVKIVVLGASGLLGSHVAKAAEESPDIALVRVGRQEALALDAELGLGDVRRLLTLSPGDVIINCIGWIPQRSVGNDSQDEALAQRLNVEIPREISEWALQTGANWIQPATDCVFSSDGGPHPETAPRQPTDVYSRSKSRGEEYCASALNIRASFVGIDNGPSLMGWLAAQPNKAVVSGFTNHFWNGVTANSLADLYLGIAQTSSLSAGNFHFVPNDWVSKAELLRLGAVAIGRPDIEVVDVEASFPIDRRLSTLNLSENINHWNAAGYDSVPSIAHLILNMSRRRKVRSGSAG